MKLLHSKQPRDTTSTWNFHCVGIEGIVTSRVCFCAKGVESFPKWKHFVYGSKVSQPWQELATWASKTNERPVVCWQLASPVERQLILAHSVYRLSTHLMSMMVVVVWSISSGLVVLLGTTHHQKALWIYSMEIVLSARVTTCARIEYTKHRPSFYITIRLRNLASTLVSRNILISQSRKIHCIYSPIWSLGGVDPRNSSEPPQLVASTGRIEMLKVDRFLWNYPK